MTDYIVVYAALLNPGKAAAISCSIAWHGGISKDVPLASPNWTPIGLCAKGGQYEFHIKTLSKKSQKSIVQVLLAGAKPAINHIPLDTEAGVAKPLSKSVKDITKTSPSGMNVDDGAWKDPVRQGKVSIIADGGSDDDVVSIRVV